MSLNILYDTGILNIKPCWSKEGHFMGYMYKGFRNKIIDLPKTTFSLLNHKTDT